MLTVNGTSCELVGKTVLEYLTLSGYDAKKVAVEQNGSIVPKAKYGETMLADDDTVEIVSFVGGG